MQVKHTKSNLLTTLVATTGILLATTLLFTVSADENEFEESQTQVQQEGADGERAAFKAQMRSFRDAIDVQDYDAWVAIVSQPPFTETFQGKVNQSTFDLLLKAHELKEMGDREGAKQVMQELGIEIKHHHGKRGGVWMDEAAKQAIEANDYNAFLEAMSETDITEAQFAALVDIHALKQQMKELSEEEKTVAKEEIKSIMQEANLELSVFHHKGRGKKDIFNQLTEEQREVLTQLKEETEDPALRKEAVKNYLDGLGIQMPEKKERSGERMNPGQ